MKPARRFRTTATIATMVLALAATAIAAPAPSRVNILVLKEHGVGGASLAQSYLDRFIEAAHRAMKADASRTEAAEASGACYYVSRESAPERRLPVELIDGALDLGNRLCGGAAGSFPGQGHEPVSADKRANVYDGFLDEVASLASDARQRLFGSSPADAEIRALLEGAFRAS